MGISGRRPATGSFRMGALVMASGVDAARDLSLAMIALQQGLIDPTQLLAAFKVWKTTQRRPMGDLLVRLGALRSADRARLERMVLEQVSGLESHAELSFTEAYHASEPVDDASSGVPSAKTQPKANDVGNQRFQVLRAHARGGLGEVSVALDKELNRQVALKELQAYHAHSPASQSRFLLEAEVTGRLEHPGIVPVYGMGRHPDGRPYYAMRLIEGETLKAAIQRFHGSEKDTHGPREREMAFQRLLRSLITACNAVAYAHSRGVVHRDLKPENIMLGQFGETLVVDWGVAKAQADQGAQGNEWVSLASGGADSSLTSPGAAV
jgi:hypothetical protein